MSWKITFTATVVLAIIGTASFVNSAQPILRRNRRQSLHPSYGEGKECTLPTPLENGRYTPSLKRCPPHVPNPGCKMIPGTLVPSDWDIFYRCDPGFVLNTTGSVSVCLDGQWSPALPVCVVGKPCPPLRFLNVDMKCIYQNKEVSCDNDMKPGTIASCSCKPHYKLAVESGYSHLTCLDNGYWDYPLFYCTEVLCPPLQSQYVNVKCVYQGKDVSCNSPMQPGTVATPACKRNCKLTYDPGYSQLTCLKTGKWDNALFYCTPACGISNESGDLTSLTKGSEEATTRPFPWHAGLYYREEDEGNVSWEQKCGGSLVTNQFVLTAANCVIGQKTNDVRVALGKSFRSWDHYEPNEEKRNVSKILWPRDYSKKTQIFDPALVLLDKEIELGESIMPVCHGFLDGSTITNDKMLYMVGWGQTENQLSEKSSGKLLYSNAVMVPPSECQQKISNASPMSEMFCSVEDNTSEVSVVKQSDFGAGMTAVHDELHYNFGILSAKIDDYAIFTNTSWPLNVIWIDYQIRKYQSTSTWIDNDISNIHNSTRGCVLPETSPSRKFCSLDQGCEDCGPKNSGCFYSPNTKVTRVRVVCSSGYSLRTPYTIGGIAICGAGGHWYPDLAECFRDKITYVPGDPWQKVTWHEARDNCLAKGYQLAVIKNQDQQSWFEEDVRKHFNETGTEPSNIWIGLSTSDELKFEWIDGSVLGSNEDEVSNFKSGEPNYLGGIEDCVEADAHDTRPYKWNDAVCSIKNYYFCNEGSGNKYIPGNPWIQVTWQEARDNCLANGTQLAVIKTKQQQDSFEEAVEKQFNDTGTTKYWIWIGLKARNERTFKWEDGSVLEGREDEAARWLLDEPNNLGGYEYCVESYLGSDITKYENGQPYDWNDSWCDWKNYYFCNKKSPIK